VADLQSKFVIHNELFSADLPNSFVRCTNFTTNLPNSFRCALSKGLCLAHHFASKCMKTWGGCKDISLWSKLGSKFSGPLSKFLQIVKRSKKSGNDSFFKRIVDPERRKKCILGSAIRMSNFAKLDLLGWPRSKKREPLLQIWNWPCGPTLGRGAFSFKLEILCKNAYLALSWFGAKRIRRWAGPAARCQTSPDHFSFWTVRQRVDLDTGSGHRGE